MASSSNPGPSTSPRVISVSVRDLVEFVLRTGNLGGERDFFAPSRALEGTRGHQKIQKLRPAGYQAEVRLKHEISTPQFTLAIKGRIDGILQTSDRLLIEEIKTVVGAWNKTADPLHWAQAKIYAWILLANGAPAAPNQTADSPSPPWGVRGRVLASVVEIQLTYLELETGAVTEFREQFALDDLREFFERVTSVYLEWAARQHEWIEQRDGSIAILAFPHAEYRHGQRPLAVAAYRASANGVKLFAEAPTGIGKTISVLFPSVKAMGEGHLEKIFFLTAKTTGRAIAEEAATLLRSSGVHLRSLTITAKDKICFNNGQPCDVQTCPFAIGYYDRIKPAILDALSHESLPQEKIQEVARRHNVCPFELSLDVSLWVDLIICDYNYVFDPKVSLKRFFSEEGGDYAFLIDEAHNLVDRAREMFSAELDFVEIAEVQAAIADALPHCAKPLRKLRTLFRRHRTEEQHSSPSPINGERAGVRGEAVRFMSRSAANPSSVERDFPADFLPPIRAFCKAAEQWLLLNQQTDFRNALRQLYFEFIAFTRTAELYDDRYVTIFQNSATGGSRLSEPQRLRLFCLDPAKGLQAALARGKSAVFFSATLRPIEYYREILGGDLADPTLQLESPFPSENLAVLLHDRVQTDFRGRASSYGEVARGIGAVVESRPGNYLVFFPSYKYLESVREQFQNEHPSIPVLTQTRSMPEIERQKFLAAFSPLLRGAEPGLESRLQPEECRGISGDLEYRSGAPAEAGTPNLRALIGFAVMGGIFGEGIDLIGDRLVGAVVVGVGLPQLCVERDLIRDYFQEKNGCGFEYAYVYPGLNRVIQAAGRVIRSESDRGIVVLMDSRFAQHRYRELLPRWWTVQAVRSATEIRERVKKFWCYAQSQSDST